MDCKTYQSDPCSKISHIKSEHKCTSNANSSTQTSIWKQRESKDIEQLKYLQILMTVYCCIHSSKFQNVWSTQGTQSLPSTFKQKKRTAEYSWTYTTKKSSLWPKTDLNDFHFTPNIRLHVNNLIQEGYINVPNFFLVPTYAEGCCKSTNLQSHTAFFFFPSIFGFFGFSRGKNQTKWSKQKMPLTTCNLASAQVAYLTWQGVLKKSSTDCLWPCMVAFWPSWKHWRRYKLASSIEANTQRPELLRDVKKM